MSPVARQENMGTMSEGSKHSAELGQQRESEATEALGALGVVPPDIHFMRLDDHSLNIYAMAGPIQQYSA